VLVTVASYRRITDDSTTAEAVVTARLEEAIEALEDVLDRPLAEAERTERLYPTRDGRLWPKAVPVTDGGDYTVDGHALRSAAPFGGWSGFVVGDESVEVTYTGGWVERTANPTEGNRLPEYIERDLAWAAHRLEHQGVTSQVPAGVISASLGDVALGWGPGGAPGGTDALSSVWSRRTLSWRYRPIGTRL
jgi:hypothetical protein